MDLRKGGSRAATANQEWGAYDEPPSEPSSSQDDKRDEEYVADGDSMGEEDDEDSIEEDSEDERPKRKAPPKRAAAPPRRGARKSSYKVDSEEELDDDEITSASDGSAPPPRRKQPARVPAAARPPRAAAQRANATLQAALGGGYVDSSNAYGGVGGSGGGYDAGLYNGAGYDDNIGVADALLAQQLDQQYNGLRPRSQRAANVTRRSTRLTRVDDDSGGGGGYGDASSSGDSGGFGAPRRRGGRNSRQQAPARASRRAIAKVSYQEESESGASDVEVKARKEPAPAFDEADASMEQEVERVVGYREIPDCPPGTSQWDSRELHVKWKRLSYIHCSWATRASLAHLKGYKRVVNYMRRMDEIEASRKYISREEQELRDVEMQMEEQLNEGHQKVERVFAARPCDASSTLSQYLVKWEGLPYSEATWESLEDIHSAGGGDQVDAFLERENRVNKGGSRTVEQQRGAFKALGVRCMDAQPEFLQGGTLRDYQLDGLNWMVYCWSENNNAILADEMGLGKTVQCASFVGYLSETQMVRGPFLVVVPLSTVPNWIKEFRKWTPMVNTIVYVGDSRSRDVLRQFEFAPSQRGSRTHKFEVLITTYELVLKDAAILNTIRWAYLIVDEAHRLKNADSALYQELLQWHFKNKLLITGTPLQNNLTELWALLHFLLPTVFHDSAAFQAQYSSLTSQYSSETANSVTQLHEALRPYLLRRIIKDVERSLPPKSERILRVEMTPLQKQYYKWILTRNFKELNKGAHGQVSLLNIITELKKTCNHPFLFESAEEGYRGGENDKSAVDRLILTSGKMVMLDKLLRRLKETGHRVLIFSQMVRMLDIISDYMRLRGFQHQRLDGSTPAQARHQAMEHFNRPESTDFAFLLSTRAGGLGINLATADTVIIYDSDWNPQNDLQACSRAHRIGQKDHVNIYRFVMGGSVEEDILERAKRKMVLDHLVIQRMDTSGRTMLDPTAANGINSAKAMFGKDELAAILRFGAEDLFKQPASAQEVAEVEKGMLEEDIDAILERAEVVTTQAGDDAGGSGGDAAGQGPADLLNSFNVATFKSKEDDAAFWNRLIPVAERVTEEALLPRAARLGAGAPDDPDTLGSGKGKARGGRQRPQAVRAVEGTQDEVASPAGGAAIRVDEWNIDVDEQGMSRHAAANGEAGPSRGVQEHMRTLSRKDAGLFVKGVRRYFLQARLPEIALEVGRALEDVSPGGLLSLWHALVDGCRRAVHLAEQEAPDVKESVTLDFFGVVVKAHDLLQLLCQGRHLARRVEELKGGNVAAKFKLDAGAQLAMPKWGNSVQWVIKDDAMLLLGCYYHGVGRWDKIAADERLGLARKLACVVAPKPEDAADKTLPKGSHFETRALGLMRKLYATASKSNGTAATRKRGGSQQTLLQFKRKETPAAMAATAAAAAVPRRVTRESAASGGSRAATSVAAEPSSRAAAAASAGGGGGSGGGTKRKAGAADAEVKGRGAAAGRSIESPTPSAAADTKARAEKRARRQAAATAEEEGGSAAGATAEEEGGTARAPSQDELWALLKPVRGTLKDLRKLSDETDTTVLLAKTQQYLLTIGRHIDAVVAEQTPVEESASEALLWQCVSKRSHNSRKGDQLKALYARLLKKDAAAASGKAGSASKTAAAVNAELDGRDNPASSGRQEEDGGDGGGSGSPSVPPPPAGSTAAVGQGGGDGGQAAERDDRAEPLDGGGGGGVDGDSPAGSSRKPNRERRRSGPGSGDDG